MPQQKYVRQKCWKFAILNKKIRKILHCYFFMIYQKVVIFILCFDRLFVCIHPRSFKTIRLTISQTFNRISEGQIKGRYTGQCFKRLFRKKSAVQKFELWYFFLCTKKIVKYRHLDAKLIIKLTMRSKLFDIFFQVLKICLLFS